MKATKSAVLSAAVIAIFFLITSLAAAQEKTSSTLRQPSAAVANDTVIEGTVVSFTANSNVPPIGAHVVVLTGSGQVDVHLGKAALLKQSNISLSHGDSIRIAGSNVPFGNGTIFAARVLQKGAQSVTLRNARGIPLAEGQSRAAVRETGARAQGVVQ